MSGRNAQRASLLFAATGVIVGLITRPNLGSWGLLAVFAGTAMLGLVVHLQTDAVSPAERRRFLGPLTLFVIVFTLVLGSRAVQLAIGDTGRYFKLSSGNTNVESVLGARLVADETENLRNLTAIPSGRRSPIVVIAPSSDARIGHRSRQIRVKGDASESGSTLVILRVPQGETIRVGGNQRVAASFFYRTNRGEGPPSAIEALVRFRDVNDKWIADRSIGSPGTRREWSLVSGSALAPRDAYVAQLALLIRAARESLSFDMVVDGPLLVPGAQATAAYLPGAPLWESAYADAIWISISLLCSVLIGYLLVGRIAKILVRGIPSVTLRRRRDRTLRAAVLIELIAGICAYVVLMRSYGGYSGYLDSLSEVWSAAQGKWYLHAVATLPTGLAVGLLARRASYPSERLSRLELGAVLAGAAIGGSFLVKTTIAIPLATILLFLYFQNRKAVIGLWIASAALVLITPFIYVIRGSGRLEVEVLGSEAYWREFVTNVLSRFFHFESLMITVPFGSSEPWWAPVRDFFISPIPRIVWEGKPLSSSARFTEKYLVPGLKSPEDIGIISLPGELWLIGGAAAILIGGLLIGGSLRLAHAAIAFRGSEPGTLLGAAALTTYLLHLNDGEGFAAVAVLSLIAAAGWLVLLRRSLGNERWEGAAREDRRPSIRCASSSAKSRE